MVSKSKLEKEKKNVADLETNRPMLISVDVMGSSGSIRFFVLQNHPVSSAIRTALVNYARQGRLPVLDSDADHFLLYCCTHDGWKRKLLNPPPLPFCICVSSSTLLHSPLLTVAPIPAMDLVDTIGSRGCRNFRLYKNPSAATCSATTTTRRRRGTFKNWFYKSFHLNTFIH